MPEGTCDMMSGTDEVTPGAVVNHDHVVRSEVAMEVVNRARTLVYARIYALEDTDRKPEAKRLQERAHELYGLLRSLDYRDQAHVEAVIDRWGFLVRDEASLWRVLQDDGPLAATA